MKKSKLFVLLGLSIVMIVMSTASIAHAAALVVKDNTCYIEASDSGLDIPLSTYDTHTVWSPSGNVSLICHFEIPEGYIPTEAIINRGFQCCLELNVCTLNTMSLASDDGDVLLKCQFKKTN